MVNDKKELFETMPVRKAISTMAIPTIISQLINLVYNVVDTFFIGRTGNKYMIAAVSIAFTIYMMTIAFGNLFGIGGGSLVARLAGKGDTKSAKSVSAFSFYGAITVAVLYSVLVSILCNPVLRILGIEPESLVFARQYIFTVVVAGDVPIILSAVLAHLVRNTGYSRQASLGLSLGGVLNIALDPLFMFVILPDGLEVLGAALATLVANCVSCVYLLYVYRKVGEKASLSMDFKAARSLCAEQRKALFSVGVPSAVLTGLFDVANMFLNARMAVYGSEAVAALGIVMKVERLPNAVNVGICQGMLPIIAYNYSAKNTERMNSVISTATRTGLIVAVIAMGLFQIFARPVTGIFVNAKSATAQGAVEMLELSAIFLRLRCLASPFQFMNFRSSFCMQAMGDGKGTLLHAVVRELVFYIPFMYILNGLFGLNGLLCSLLAGEFCGMVFAVILLKRWLARESKA